MHDVSHDVLPNGFGGSASRRDLNEETSRKRSSGTYKPIEKLHGTDLSRNDFLLFKLICLTSQISYLYTHLPHCEMWFATRKDTKTHNSETNQRFVDIQITVILKKISDNLLVNMLQCITLNIHCYTYIRTTCNGCINV